MGYYMDDDRDEQLILILNIHTNSCMFRLQHVCSITFSSHSIMFGSISFSANSAAIRCIWICSPDNPMVASSDVDALRACIVGIGKRRTCRRWHSLESTPNAIMLGQAANVTLSVNYAA